jgi:hypothetical protein
VRARVWKDRVFRSGWRYAVPALSAQGSLTFYMGDRFGSQSDAFRACERAIQDLSVHLLEHRVRRSDNQWIAEPMFDCRFC